MPSTCDVFVCACALLRGFSEEGFVFVCLGLCSFQFFRREESVYQVLLLSGLINLGCGCEGYCIEVYSVLWLLEDKHWISHSKSVRGEL